MTDHDDPCDLCDDCGGYTYDLEGWPKAVPCEACDRRAPDCYLRKLRQKLIDRNTGNQVGRTRGEIGAREETFARHWAKANRAVPGLNDSRTLLQCILRNCKTGDEPTERDYLIAATVFQFLGSNGGKFLLGDIDRELKACRRGGVLP